MTPEDLVQEFMKQAEALFDAEIPVWLLKRKIKGKADLLRLLRANPLHERPEIWRRDAQYNREHRENFRDGETDPVAIGAAEFYRMAQRQGNDQPPFISGDYELCLWLASELLAMFPEKKA